MNKYIKALLLLVGCGATWGLLKAAFGKLPGDLGSFVNTAFAAVVIFGTIMIMKGE